MQYRIDPMPYNHFVVWFYCAYGTLVGAIYKHDWTPEFLRWYKDRCPDLLAILTDELKERGLLPM